MANTGISVINISESRSHIKIYLEYPVMAITRLAAPPVKEKEYWGKVG
jgi:hypothetical protein